MPADYFIRFFSFVLFVLFCFCFLIQGPSGVMKESPLSPFLNTFMGGDYETVTACAN